MSAPGGVRASPHPSVARATPDLPARGRYGVCCSAATRHAGSFPRCITRPDFDDLAPRNEGWRAEKRKPMVSRPGEAARAPLGAPIADVYGIGPRFPVRARAQVGRRPVAQKPKSSASSWQRLLSGPGGSSGPLPEGILGQGGNCDAMGRRAVPPECLVAQGPQAPHPVPPHDTS